MVNFILNIFSISCGFFFLIFVSIFMMCCLLDVDLNLLSKYNIVLLDFVLNFMDFGVFIVIVNKFNYLYYFIGIKGI